MMQQAIDFKDECDGLFTLLEPLSDADFQRTTLFKDWSINAVIGHLHVWNWAAETALQDPDEFQCFLKRVIAGMSE